VCWPGQEPGYFFQQSILITREREESIYPFLGEIRHKVIRTISGKHNDAGLWMPRLDFRNDDLDAGCRKACVCCNHQVKLSVRYILKDIGESAIGLNNRYMEAMFSKYLLKAGSNYILFRYDENFVNRPTSYNKKAGTQIGHRLRSPMNKLWTMDYIICSAN
jgi:hypothetical protein